MKVRFSVCLVLLVLAVMFSGMGLAQKPIVRIGTVTDGPFERDQVISATLQKAVVSKLEATHDVRFPAEKKLYGDWSRGGVRAAIDRLMADEEVDYIITLGILSSYEASTRRYLAKPTIASRVIAPDLLHIPSEVVDGQVVSGVDNLSYVTVVGVKLKQAVTLFREIVGFSRLTFVVMEPIRQIYPDLENAVKTVLRDLELDRVDFVFLKDDISRPLRRISEETEAVALSPLPQLESGEFQELLGVLRQMKLPTLTLGSRQDVEAGVMLGINAKHELDLVADRVASNLQQIVNGTDASLLPVQLGLQESLAINNAAAAAIGFDVQAALNRKAEEADQAAGVSSPSMSPVADERAQYDLRRSGPELTQEELEARQTAIIEQVQRAIFRLAGYSAFDALSFRVEGASRVVLLGFAFTPDVKSAAEVVVRKIEEVEEVENLIEVLPNSPADDDIRARAYVAIYGHPSMRRYVPGAGFSSADVRNFVRDLRVNLRAAQMTKGPHAIHILVKNGNLALVGYVFSEMDKQIAEVQASSVPGAFSVENHLEVVKR